MKYRPNRVNCNNGYFTDGGSEQNPDGTYTPLPSDTAWYAFDNMDKGVQGYYQFIAISAYDRVRQATSPLAYLQAIKACGYATSLQYVQNVWNTLITNNLTVYDNFNSDTSQSTSTPTINIIKQTSLVNITAKTNRNIDWIVLHYTAGTQSKAGTAKNIASYFAKTSTKASADFIVDNGTIVQYNPDPRNFYCWSVGGSKYSTMTTSLGGKYYGICTNANSISIEMCSSKINTSSMKASDSDWYFSPDVVKNAFTLVKYLMSVYGITSDHVIMHHMVTGKLCPSPWTVNEGALQNYYNFIQGLGGTITPTPSVPSEDTTIPIKPTPVNPVTKKALTDYLPKGIKNTPTMVQVLIDDLNIRDNPNGNKINKFTGIGIYSIVEVQGDWGLLKSYEAKRNGWIKISNPAYTVEIPFLIQALTNDTLIRQGPDGLFPLTEALQKVLNTGKKYTITSVVIDKANNLWFKLKSNTGWIQFDPSRIKILDNG